MPQIEYHEVAAVSEETFAAHYQKTTETFNELMEIFSGTMAEQNAQAYSRLVQVVGLHYGHCIKYGYPIPPVPDYKRINASIEAIASQDGETAFNAAKGLWPEDVGEAIPAAIVGTVRALFDKGGQGLKNVLVGQHDTSLGGRAGYMSEGPRRGELTSLRSRYQDVDERLKLLATLLHATFNRCFERQILRERERIEQSKTDGQRAYELLSCVEHVLAGLEAHPHLAPNITRDREILERLATSLAKTVNAAPVDDPEQPEQPEAAA